MWRHGRRQEDFADEIRAHIEMETARLVSEGLSKVEAIAQARREFGNTTRVEERFYESNRLSLGLETLLCDLRYGLRSLRKSPVFTLAALLSLALGIGANVALFQLVNAVMLRSLPVRNAQELVRFTWKGGGALPGNHWGFPSEFSNPQWERLREKRDVFAGMFACARNDFNIAPTGEIKLVKGLFASGGMFQTLGVPAELGRVLTESDDRRGCGPGLAVLSHSFWQREYRGSRSVIGRTVFIWTHPVEIIGVTPEWFHGVEMGKQFDVAIPICAEPSLGIMPGVLDDRHTFWLGVSARLKPGVTAQQASTYLQAKIPAILEATVHPGWRPDQAADYLKNKLGAAPGGNGYSELRESVSNPLLMLLAIAGLVLLIACANLANLMLARASTRQSELAIRLSLGASRGRVIRQLLSESLLLAVGGCALGALLAQALTRYLVASFATTMDSPFLNLSPDGRTFGFMAALVVVCCLLFGLAPALRATRGGSGETVRADNRGQTATRERFGLQRILVVSQIALSLILVLAALLFVRSFTKLVTLDPGFREDGVLAVGVGFNDPGLNQHPVQALERILDALRHVPGVDHAATVQDVPLAGNTWSQEIRMDHATGWDQPKGSTGFNRVSNDYFRTMSTPLYAGRDFDARDRVGAQDVAIVDQTFVERFSRDENPLGRTFLPEYGPGETSHHYQIVGVVKRTKYASLQSEFEPTVFVPLTQDDETEAGSWFVVHTRLPLGATTAAVRHALEGVSPGLMTIFSPMPDIVRDSVRHESLLAKLSGFFGFLAIVLATVGLYGVSSYLVAQRRHEIGLRLALGAQRRTILRMMLTQSCVLLLAGLIIGFVVALAAGRLAESLLFELKPNDPSTIGLALVGVSLVSFLASLIPALKASNIPPMAALREE